MMSRDQRLSLAIASLAVALLVLTGFLIAERELLGALITFCLSLFVIGSGFMLKKRRV